MIFLSDIVILAIFLFTIGITIIVIKENIFFIILGIEIMIHASALLFVISSIYWDTIDGQIAYILVITVAAVESAIFLSLIFKLHSNKIDNIDLMNEISE